MNIIENIVWYLILSLLLIVSINYISWIMNLAYVTQSNFEATSILEKTEVNLRYNLDNINVDKNVVDYEIEYKDKFLDGTFTWLWVSIWTNIKEGMEFRCYNYYLDGKSINTYKLMDNNLEVDYSGDYYKTDEDGASPWTQYMNIMCLYNTYDYIWASNIINDSKSPISYVLYSFYKDLRFSKKLVEKKGILYFN